MRKFVTVFGTCVITASLFSGCATEPRPDRIPMTTADLNHYRIDCSRKHRVLYDRDLPFRGRREEPKTVFRRKPKHPKRDEVI